MKSVGIAKIEKNNPILNYYKKAIQSWNPEQNFVINGDYFYGVFLDDKFMGASTMDFNEETSITNILILNNNSYDYNMIQQESAKQLTDIALEQYDTKKINVSYVKKLGSYR